MKSKYYTMLYYKSSLDFEKFHKVSKFFVNSAKVQKIYAKCCKNDTEKS